ELCSLSLHDALPILVSPAEWAGDWPAKYWIHQIHRSVDLVFEQECRACAVRALCSPTPARRADAYPPHVGGVIGQQAPEFLEARSEEHTSELQSREK